MNRFYRVQVDVEVNGLPTPEPFEVIVIAPNAWEASNIAASEVGVRAAEAMDDANGEANTIVTASRPDSIVDIIPDRPRIVAVEAPSYWEAPS